MFDCKIYVSVDVVNHPEDVFGFFSVSSKDEDVVDVACVDGQRWVHRKELILDFVHVRNSQRSGNAGSHW